MELLQVKIILFTFYSSFAVSVKNGRQKFPGTLSDLQVKMVLIDGKDNHSHIKVTWLTEMEKKFFIHQGSSSINDLYSKIKYYNQICEDDRNWDNQDEEPEDETLLLT